jgi:nucleolar complex protein 2
MKLKKGKAVEKLAKKHVAKKKKKNIADASVDEFFNLDFENMDLSDDEEKKGKNDKTVEKNIFKADFDSGDSDMDAAEHKKSLHNLKDTDPEFFEYLKKNDTKLLDFNVDDDEDEIPDKNNSKHVPDYELQVCGFLYI